MKTLARYPMTSAWAVLLAATLASVTLAESAAAAKLATTAVVIIAAIKVRLIFLNFMELKTGMMPWRVIFEVWTAVATGILLVGYWLTA